MYFYIRNKHKEKQVWHIWFAWFPVFIDTPDGDFKIVFLENVMRCGRIDRGFIFCDLLIYKYKQIPRMGDN
jgi:hypothetical protein